MELKIQNNFLTATFRLKGGELRSLKTNQKEYLLNDEKYWNYTSPILFPTVGKLRDGYTYIDDKKYEIPQHGLVRTEDFTLKSHKDNEIVFSFSSNEKTLKAYPYEFELQLKYKLLDKKMISEIKVINKDKKNLFFNLGLHPAFLLENEFSSYKIVFEENETNNIPSIESNGTINFDLIQKQYENLKTLNLNYQDYVNDALIFRGCNSSYACLLDKNNKGLKFGFEQFSTVAIWTKNTLDGPFICIEPWIGYADKHNSDHNFLNKDYLIQLNAQDEITLEYYFEIID